MSSAKILSVLWHNVESDKASINGTNPTLSVFREHIRFFREHYTPISVQHFLRVRDDKSLIHFYDKPPVLLGFDDGFKNVICYALPILEEFKAPAVFFVIGEILRNPGFVPWYVEMKHMMRRTVKKKLLYGNTSIDLAVPKDAFKLKRLFMASFSSCTAESDRQKLLIDFADLLAVDRPREADLDDDLKFVDRTDLANLQSSSLLTVASHAMSHRDLAALSYEEQGEELEVSDSLLRLHCPSYYPVIAYPNGSFNSKTVSIARRIYKAGFAVLLGASYRNLYAYPRIGLANDSVGEVAYAVSSKRRNYILPVKRLLHVTGIRPL